MRGKTQTGSHYGAALLTPVATLALTSVLLRKNPDSRVVFSRYFIYGLLALGLALTPLSKPHGLHAGNNVQKPAREVRFKKIALDREFRSEGVTVADVNRDGKTDVIAGNLWYEAPNWTPHEIQSVKQFDAAKAYSNSFVNFAAELNNDGWIDQIRIGLPATDRVVWH